ncbi:hypothetical protein HNP40_001278 [Mycobacteroides chelonae]|nr:hypothetical protein [Mycobacteroides chelonae]
MSSDFNVVKRVFGGNPVGRAAIAKARARPGISLGFRTLDRGCSTTQTCGPCPA